MNATFLEEPELEFGSGRHIDIRFGIMNCAPLDFDSALAPKNVPLGLVGSKESIEGMREWLERCAEGIEAKQSNKPALFPRFSGCAPDRGFRCSMVITDSLSRDLPASELSKLAAIKNHEERVIVAADLCLSEIAYLSQNTQASVIVCAIPLEMLEAINANSEDAEDGTQDGNGQQMDFHDLLEAKAMQLYRKPIQIVLPSTYDPSKQRKQTKAGHARTLQDEATRAWNIHTALYYKAGGVPWRLLREPSALTVCYVGVSFYQSLDRSQLFSSVAQVFNERGEGVVVRGGAAVVSKADRQPHLPEDIARDLLSSALSRYREVHKNFPARIVVHKSSRFDEHEVNGFTDALRSERVDGYDFLSISGSSSKLFRLGQYPPLRGTLLSLDESEMVLYTRGSVQFFETYPGKYVPVPLRIRCDRTSETQKFLSKEIMALTKMNWNNTQFDGSDPVTLRAARQCGSVLRYCSPGLPIEPRYSFYM